MRLIDPTLPTGATLTAPPPAGWFDPNGTAITEILNHEVNFGWEYVYHCHILAHEEMDMMHATAFTVPPLAPTDLTAVLSGVVPSVQVDLNWVTGSLNASSFTIQRSIDNFVLDIQNLATVDGSILTYSDVIGDPILATYYYRVFASNTVGDIAMSNFPVVNIDSGLSNVATW